MKLIRTLKDMFNNVIRWQEHSNYLQESTDLFLQQLRAHDKS